MKTKTKGIIFFALVAGIMLASGITIAIPGKEIDDADIAESVEDVEGDTIVSLDIGQVILTMKNYSIVAQMKMQNQMILLENTRYQQNALNLSQSQRNLMVQFGLHKQTLVILQNLIQQRRHLLNIQI